MAKSAKPTEPVVAYSFASDLQAPDWKVLMREASQQIDLLSLTLQAMLGTPGVPGLIATKAGHDCPVRILVSHPPSHLAQLLRQDGIQTRVLDAPASHTIYRFDEQLLVLLHLRDERHGQAPLLHITRSASDGLFDRLAQHYKDLWENASRPLDHDRDIPHDLGIGEQLDGATQQPARRQSPPACPRRWPGRPT